MIHERQFVLHSLILDTGKQLFILLKLRNPRAIATNTPAPELRKFTIRCCFVAFLAVRFADDGALQVEELAVDCFEEAEEGGRVGEFGVDAFFEDVKEFGKGALESGFGDLVVGLAEEVGEEFGGAGAEGAVDVGVHVFVDGGEAVGHVGGDLREFALGPFHYD